MSLSELRLLNGTVLHNVTNTDFCTLDLCPMLPGLAQYDYIPSLAANAIFLVLFAMSLVGHIGQGVWWRTWGFTVAFALGNAAEVIGYVGRTWSHHNPFLSDPFMMQIICLTFAPAFLTAGIYLCLSRIVVLFGAEISRIKPKMYTYIFMTCDIISLVLQSAGGAIAATADDNAGSDNGTHIMVGGLVFQVITMSLFMFLCAEYAWRVSKSAIPMSSVAERVWGTRRFKGFLVALVTSTLLIYVRSIYRAVELSQGWHGYLINHEGYFIVLEGVLVVMSVLILNVFHPGMSFQEAYQLGGKGGKSAKDIELENMTYDELRNQHSV